MGREKYSLKGWPRPSHGRSLTAGTRRWGQHAQCTKNDFTDKYSYRVVVIHRNCFGAAAITLLEPEDIAFWYGGKGGLFIADAVGPVTLVLDLRITDERWGSSSNPLLTGICFTLDLLT